MLRHLVAVFTFTLILARAAVAQQDIVWVQIEAQPTLAEATARAQAYAADPKTGRRIIMAHPAYDQCIKASHLFNLLDARGVISVTERQAYIGRVRALAKQCADAFVQTEAGGWAA